MLLLFEPCIDELYMLSVYAINPYRPYLRAHTNLLKIEPKSPAKKPKKPKKAESARFYSSIILASTVVAPFW